VTNRLKKQEETFEIVAQAKTEAQAMEHVFAQVKQRAYEHCKGYLIEMHVDSFELQAIDEIVEIKKFLYFLLPKESKMIQLKTRVRVSIDYINRGLQAG